MQPILCSDQFPLAGKILIAAIMIVGLYFFVRAYIRNNRLELMFFCRVRARVIDKVKPLTPNAWAGDSSAVVNRPSTCALGSRSLKRISPIRSGVGL
jgi:hypothetical protein